MNKVDCKILEDPNVGKYDKKYYASRFGDIYSTRGKNVYKLKTYKNNKTLSVKIYEKECAVARIVWEVFRGPIPEGYIISHKDGAATNCELHNLTLITQKEKSKLMRKAQIRRYPYVKDLDTGIEYRSTTACAKALNYTRDHISHICSGRNLPSKVKVVYIPQVEETQSNYKRYAYIKDDYLMATGTMEEICSKYNMESERFRYLVRKDKIHPNEKMIAIGRI